MMHLKLLFTIAISTYAITGLGQQPSNVFPPKFKPANDFVSPRLILRTILITDEKNYLLQTPALETSLIDILLTGINTGAIVAYRADNDSLVLTQEQMHLMLSANTNSSTPIIKPDAITKLYMKEEWIFQRDKGRMVVRITNIAPVIKVIDTMGVVHEQPAFWLPYIDIRDFLATQKVVATPAEKDKIENLRDVIDGRYFIGEIVE